MARSNASTTACFSAASGITAAEAKKLGDLADQYNTGDITGDYVSATQDVLAEATALRDAIKAAYVKQSPMFTKKAAKVKDPYTAAQLEEEFKEFLVSSTLGHKIIVVDTATDLLDLKDLVTAANNETAMAWTRDGKAIIVADRIERGTGKSVLLHEVGVHLGMKNLLGEALFNKLTAQVEAWAQSGAKTQEAKLARAALARVEAAETNAEDRAEEMLAYFVEEAVNAGVDPTAVKNTGPLQNFFRQLWAAFKVAIRRLGMDPAKLTASNIVDLAYGAARLEARGQWHGTAARFRKFNHDYMGTGEGAQAFGWGSYLAMRGGIAYGYWKADVKRKTVNPDGAVFDGKSYTRRELRDLMAGGVSEASIQASVLLDVMRNGVAGTKSDLTDKVLDFAKSVYEIYEESSKRYGVPFDPAKAEKEAMQEARDTYHGKRLQWLEKNADKITSPEPYTPEGSLKRTDILVPDNSLLDWDSPMEGQGNVLSIAQAKLPAGLIEQMEEEANASLSEMTGEEFYRALQFLEEREGVVSEQFEVEDYNKRLADAGPKKIVSMYLDSLGIHGIRFYDGDSRPVADKVNKEFNRKKQAYEDLKSDKDFGYEVDEADLAAAKAEYEKARSAARKMTENLVIFNDQNITRVATHPGADRSKVRFSKAAPADMQTRPKAEVSKMLDSLPAGLRPTARSITNALSTLARKGLNAAVFTEDLLTNAKNMGMAAAQTYKDLFNQRSAFTGEHERRVLDTVTKYNALPDAVKGKGPGTVNQYLYDSASRKWGYQPSWLGKKVDIDPETAKQYEALGPEGQKFVDDVFRLGAETLKQKKEIVLAATASEFDALIADAQKAGDKDAVDKYTKDKADALKKFGSLLRLSENEPYAPRKRFGKYVVIGASSEYLTAKENGDTAEMRKLEQDEQHYFVDFAESQGDAERMLDKLKATGNYEDPHYRERNEMRDDLYGGSKTLQALGKLRARLDYEGTGSNPIPPELRDSMRKALTDLYLMQLAEDSSRKSEMTRRNIAGDLDMIRSVEAQGMADARLLGSLKYGQAMLESIGTMARESTQGGNRLQKSEIFNEIAKRYTQAQEYEPAPWSQKLVKATSTWFLATSPSYYLQNLTQPWTMSLPVMAAKFGYADAASKLYAAYGDLTGSFGKETVFGQMDFEALLSPDNKKLQADEKAMIRKFLNSGRIDIGMISELGDAKVDPDGKAARAWNRVDQGMRGLQLKVESINRLTTALAAYRLEKAKNGSETAAAYADDVLQNTHGDYSAWNAPRAFNTNIGKVALQFRKFQLVQLTLMAKLLRNSFYGASKEERALARRAFAYTLGQAAIVGGGKALPIPFALSWAFAAMAGEGVDEPPEYIMRRLIGDKDVADLLLNGIGSTLLGINMTNIAGMGNAMSIVPFADFDLTNRKNATEYGFALLSGPLGGLTLRAADGIGKISNGDVYGGMANLLPKGFTNVMKALGTATEGVKQADGDQVMQPDEVTAWDTAQQALGFTPQRQSDRMYRQNAEYKIEKAIHADSSAIKAEYTQAVKSGDAEARNEALQKWRDYQDLRDRMGFKRQPMSDLIKAPQLAAKRERDTAGNVQYNKTSERFVRELADR